MNKVIATITKMTMLTALLLAVSPQAYAGNMSFDNLYPNAQLSENIDKKLKSFDKKKESAWKEMKEFYMSKDIKGTKEYSNSDNSMGWDDEYTKPYYVEYSSKKILSYIGEYMDILEPYGYYFYTKEEFWAKTVADLTIGIPPSNATDSTGYIIQDFLGYTFSKIISNGKSTNSSYVIKEKVKNKKEDYYVVALNYSKDNILPYNKINIKIDNKKKIVSFWHSN